MGKKSTICRLPPEQKRQIDRWIADGQLTYEQMETLAREAGMGVSKSAIHRYGKGEFETLAKDLRYAQAVSDALVKELGESGDIGRMIAQSGQTLLLKLRMQLAKNEEADLDSDEIVKLGRATKDFALAMKASVDVEEKIADALEKRVSEQTKALEAAAPQLGLTKATVDAFKELVLFGGAKR